MAFALTTSLLEVVTALVIVVFAQVLNAPETGLKYLGKIGFSTNLSPGRVIFYIAIIMGAIYLIKNLIVAGEIFFQNFSIQKMNYHFKNKLLRRYAQADYGFYLTRNSSLGMQIVSGDTEATFLGGMLSIASIVSEGVIFFTLMGMIIYMNPSLALTIFVIGGMVSMAITKSVLPRFYRFGQKLQEADLYSGQNLGQFFHAFKEIVLLGKRESFIEAYQVYARKKASIQAIQTSLNALPRIVIEILFVALFITTITILCLDKESPVQMMGILGGYLYTGFRLMPGLNRIINQLNAFKSVIPSIERVHHEYTMVAAKENYVDVPTLQFNQSVEIKDLSFKYLNTEKNALSHISLQIQKSECIGIVGETGSGKSTLVDLILGLLTPYEGSIFVDGQYPVYSYQWHQKIGYVPQSIYLTDDTIEKNIAFGEKQIDLNRLNSAIDAAQLRTFIDALPEGAKTIAGERGIRLSGGERQRIAIARALYRNPEVLIFDEATSALDTDTEARLMETINAVSKDRTVIMIAHRLTTLKDCDRIVVMDKGCVKQVTDYNALQNKVVQHE
ncbi:ABC transporter ATP-binding protein [Holospora curviuscula]|uniref:Lipid A export ATP-binding/permease protein MsbA n=1 Tax=Holospora curviuscula TaxID=1082868 RepID=A0A2S5R7H5_9PROT|nr:ABC transporter ATP-binding protein [Holospora curviuscula]PPE03132.1 Lipid A export ATP-binding/permease protein MsbA [Holospora curviuscula]